ncbi:hypothetical protein GCM10028803_34140 [Larkinella knui]
MNGLQQPREGYNLFRIKTEELFGMGRTQNDMRYRIILPDPYQARFQNPMELVEVFTRGRMGGLVLFH